MTQTYPSKTYLLVNFGGPRTLNEVEPFLCSLLTDQDVVRTGLPTILHNYIFKKAAKTRSVKVAEEYESMGGKSPIYADTEAVAKAVEEKLQVPLITFHRYIPETHAAFIEKMRQVEAPEIRVFPMFPQFTYATTGSIARWFRENLPYSLVSRLRWVKSYSRHPAFVKSHQNNIRDFLNKNDLKEEETILLFSSHGIPESFVKMGDPYQYECQRSFESIQAAFPKVQSRLCFQSKFGPGEWLKPYTIDVCEDIQAWNIEKRPNVVFVPLSFTSDHIETLCEIENDYMTVIRDKGFKSYRVPALTLRNDWLDAICEIVEDSDYCGNQMLIRPGN